MEKLLHQFKALSVSEASVVFLVANLFIFLTSVGACWLFGRIFKNRRIFDRWEPFSAVELAAALGAVVLNAAVSVLGWLLWKNGLIDLPSKAAGWVILDTLIMILAMDLGMYALHRAAHHPLLYSLFQRFHHRHEVTNPISLFVLHPLEVAGFGGLMIAVLMLVPIAPFALIAYLTLNVLFGTLGHSGVEPFSRHLRRVPLLNLIGTSTFHAEHHERPRYNFGFYTLIWDQIFGTLDPNYWDRYSAAAQPRASE